MIVLQLMLAVLLVSLDTGPIGKYSVDGFTPVLSILVLWAFSWFGSAKLGWQFAFISGLLLDLVGFLSFGLWLIVLFIVAGFIILTKERFFEVSSAPLALISLFLATLIGGLLLALFTGSLDYQVIILGALYNTLSGLVIYYVLATRFRFLQRWIGRRV